jgi:hypothetical protein
MSELRPHACGERARAVLVSRIVPSAEAPWFTPSLASILGAPNRSVFGADKLLARDKTSEPSINAVGLILWAGNQL